MGVTEPALSQEKERHGCLTAYLVVMILANSAMVLLYVFGSEAVNRSHPTAPNWALPVLSGLGIFNIVCAIALLRLKKWGFWGQVTSAAIIVAVNLAIGLGAWSAFGGLVAVLILYGVLHIGATNKGWPQLD